MRFSLSVDEIVYIKQTYKFGRLLGVDEERGMLGDVDLLGKGYITQHGAINELCTELRLLFSAWRNARYTLTRPGLNTEHHFMCLLSDDKNIIIYETMDDNAVIDFFDYSIDIMDNLICGLSGLDTKVICDNRYNIRMAVNDFEEFCKQNDIEGWEARLGVSADALREYLDAIKSEQNVRMILTEDHEDKIGCLIKVVNTPKAIYAIKHVTRETQQHVVLLMGDAHSITDSIYIF